MATWLSTLLTSSSRYRTFLHTTFLHTTKLTTTPMPTDSPDNMAGTPAMRWFHIARSRTPSPNGWFDVIGDKGKGKGKDKSNAGDKGKCKGSGNDESSTKKVEK